jgi:hypothetical protein
VTVPETAVDEDSSLVLPQNNIRLARKIIPMKTESIAHPVQNRPDNSFWTCIGALD